MMDLKRKKAAEKKRRQRAQWSAEKKEEVKAKRRLVYAAKVAGKGRHQSVGVQTDGSEKSELSSCTEQLGMEAPTCISTPTSTTMPPDMASTHTATIVDTPNTMPSSRSARRKRLSRLRQFFPRNADHYVELLEDMQNISSPSKKAALEKVSFKNLNRRQNRGFSRLKSPT